nr:LysR substrate-binding domain-containing protein [Sulfitobacter sp. THAF37]
MIQPLGNNLTKPTVEITQHFSEEVHAIDSAIAGQGVVLASSALAASAVAAGQLVCLSDTDLPGRTFWAVCRADHPRLADIERFSSWVRASA